MNKKILWGIIILVILAGAVLAARFFLGGDEDNWLCQDGNWTKHGNPAAPMPTSGCEQKAQQEGQQTGQNAGLANPASVNCLNKGGTEETRTDNTGGQYGVCKFSNGSECDSWKFFRGECSVDESKK